MADKGGISRKKNGMPKPKNGCAGLVGLVLMLGPAIVGATALIKIL